MSPLDTAGRRPGPAAARRKPVQDSIHPPNTLPASAVEPALTPPADSSILRAGPAASGPPRTNLRGTNRVEIVIGSIGRQRFGRQSGRVAPTAARGMTGRTVRRFFAAVRHRRGEGVYQTRHVPGERHEQPVRRAPTTPAVSMDHRYSPYRTCVSFDWSPGEFLASRDASRPMMVVLSHSHSRSTRNSKIDRTS